MRETAKPSDAVHVELLASVFATSVPTTVMSLLFAGVGAVATLRIGDMLVALLYGAGLVASAARLGVAVRCRPRFRDAWPSPQSARRIERLFGVTYVAFAVLLGAFAARVLWLGAQRLETVVVALIVGYAAGVSTGVALRPRIGIAAMLCGVVPVIAIAFVSGGAEGPTLAITLVGLLGGGIRSTLVRYRASLAEIAERHLSASQARSDPLTGLPNRLALAEHLDAARASGAPTAICCIDLDDFKPINDRHGHAVGDGVLCEAAERLRGLAGAGDLAARVGGDEFVFVGLWAASEEDRRALARRVAVAMGQPYFVDGRWVPVGASVGVAMLDPADHPEQAIARADRALYDAKRVSRERAREQGPADDTPVRLRHNGLASGRKRLAVPADSGDLGRSAPSAS
ncbi:diguanylate cyclase domain-containing protein [Sphingomonas sp.]|uniref:GGDEF domain-containing protein n=1 Tax=Sphingomonas sp. TaxID=28214 RepID=UPI003B00E8CE